MGLMIGTRPDCFSDEVIDLIASYKKDNFELWVEIGMQTSCDYTLHAMNRGHGHGAGLCKYGAEALARTGREYQAILAWYYPAVEPVQAYG